MENFETVIRKYQIQIPIIQRDYAQGRDNPKANEIRTIFLESIFETLKLKKNLHLDFIYGSIREAKFIPLDGQQRLTTLFLLYWYFGKKQKVDISFLSNFTYETRASSREFCLNLVNAEIDFSNRRIGDWLKDSKWFLASWENDPTIRSMIKMIEDIHVKFYNENYYDQLNLISFNFFELEEFGLDDDLYIKMNARGKSLTEFENFKAKFEQHINVIDENLAKEFSHKIDNSWTDFFWKYCILDGSYKVDDFLLRFIMYIAEMLYYKRHTSTIDGKLSYNQIRQIFNDRESILFLIKSLDRLPKINQSFEDIFSTYEYMDGKVCLFDDSINLLDKVILKDKAINIQQRIFLFIIIEHLSEFEVNSELKDLLRVTRNLTYRINHLKTGSLIYSNDLSFSDLNSLLNIFSDLINQKIYSIPSALENVDISKTPITKTSIKHELEKVQIISSGKDLKEQIFKLEDYRFLKGNLTNFIANNHVPLQELNTILREIFTHESDTVIRAMLTIDDYTLRKGNTWLGDKYFFGKDDYWEIILTAQNTEKICYAEFYNEFLKSYINCNRDLNIMIDIFLDTNSEKDWRYYFIKYPAMIEFNSNLSSDYNLFAWSSDFEVEKMGGSNLNAYHVNPYIRTVAIPLSEAKVFLVSGVDTSYLEFKGMQIFSLQKGWKIHLRNTEIPQNIIDEFQLVHEEDFYFIKEKGNLDRIETLIEFLNVVE